MINFVLSPFPSDLIVVTSPAPIRVPKSDGLIGVACTSINTSSGPGAGFSTSESPISRVAFSLMVEVSCNIEFPYKNYLKNRSFAIRDKTTSIKIMTSM